MPTCAPHHHPRPAWNANLKWSDARCMPWLLLRTLTQRASAQDAKLDELGRQLKAASKQQSKLEAELQDVQGKLEEAAAASNELEVHRLPVPGFPCHHAPRHCAPRRMHSSLHHTDINSRIQLPAWREARCALAAMPLAHSSLWQNQRGLCTYCRAGPATSSCLHCATACKVDLHAVCAVKEGLWERGGATRLVPCHARRARRRSCDGS